MFSILPLSFFVFDAAFEDEEATTPARASATTPSTKRTRRGLSLGIHGSFRGRGFTGFIHPRGPARELDHRRVGTAGAGGAEADRRARYGHGDAGDGARERR